MTICTSKLYSPNVGERQMLFEHLDKQKVRQTASEFCDDCCYPDWLSATALEDLHRGPGQHRPDIDVPAYVRSFLLVMSPWSRMIFLTCSGGMSSF